MVKYRRKGDVVIYNKKYHFIFNHESPGHGNLYITQQWENVIDHFVQNNFEEFIHRYRRRVENMRELLKSGEKLTFILSRPNTAISDISESHDVIKNKYPSLTFTFTLLGTDARIFVEHLQLMRINDDDNEIHRLIG